MKKVSLIVPITERHDKIAEIYEEYRNALSDARVAFEIIFVVDGQYDIAYQQLKSLKEKGEDLAIIKHARTFGESTAITTGFHHASGDIIMLAPAYRQVEPSEFPKIIGSMGDSHMVVVRRWPRSDSRWNQFQTGIFHRLVAWMTGDVASDIGCGVRLFKRQVLDEINLYGDIHRFLPIMAYRQGFRIKEVDAAQSSKEKRLRTYPLGIYIRRVIDLMTVFFLLKFTKKPLRFFGLTGSAVLLAGLSVTLYLVIVRLFLGVGLSDRPLFLIGILFVVLGLQIFAIGLIGEIIIFTHAREIKEYSIEEIIN